MSNHRSIYVGTYIELENDYVLEDHSEILDCCLNESCENNSNKISGNFCPKCGSKVIRIEKTGKKKVHVDVYNLCETLFENGDRFNKYNKHVFGNLNTDPYIDFDHNEDIDMTFSHMFEILEKSKTEDFKTLSNKLNELGFKNSIKAGIVSYWS